MKKTAFVIVFGLLVILLAVAATDDKDVPETITLKNEKGDVVFPHKAHHELEYTCKTCHHNVEKDMDTPDKKCHDCHTTDSDVTAQNALHKSCRDCHRDYKKEHSDSEAPTSCSKCHVKS